EVHALRPAVIVCLGSVAAQAVIGPHVRVTRDGGVALPSTFGIPAFATIHPSAVLRAPGPEARAAGRARLVEDLRAAARSAGLWRRPQAPGARCAASAAQRVRRPLAAVCRPRLIDAVCRAPSELPALRGLCDLRALDVPCVSTAAPVAATPSIAANRR